MKIKSEEIPTGKEVKWYQGGTLVQESRTITAADVTATKIALNGNAEYGSVWLEKDGKPVAAEEFAGTDGADPATDATGTTHVGYAGITADDVVTITYIDITDTPLTHIATSQGVTTSTTATTLSQAVDGAGKKITRTMSRETTADISELIYSPAFVAAVIGDSVETEVDPGDGVKVKRTKWSDISTGFKKIGGLVGKRYVGNTLTKKYILMGCEATKYDGAFPTETYYSRSFSFSVDHQIEAQV